MDPRRAAPALAGLIAALVGPLTACVADTDGLLTPGRDAGVQPGLDARAPDADTSNPDGGPAPDAAASDATAPDATPCGPGRTARTIASSALDLDLAPSGDRLMVDDGNQVTVYDLPTGRFVQNSNRTSGALTRDGRRLLLDLGNGELVTQGEQGLFTRVSTDFACDHQLTPDRRHLVAVVACRDVPGGALVGRLEITDLETGGVFRDDDVLVRSLRATHERHGVPRIAYQRRPEGTACSRCPTSASEVVEVTLQAASDAAPPNRRLFIDLVGYSPDQASLVARTGICGCGPDTPLTSVLFHGNQSIVDGIVRSYVLPEPLDSHGLSAFAQSPTALGRNGMLTSPLAPDGDLIYTPYDRAQAPVTVMTGVGPSAAVVLTTSGRDSAVLTTDPVSQLVRIPLSGTQMAEVLSPPGSFGVPSLIVSEDRSELAFVAESGGQVVISELLVGSATGPVSVVHSSGEPIQLRGFLPDRRGVLAVVDGGALRLFRGATALDIDSNVDPTGPIVIDAQGCWVAHRRAGAAAEVRVVPLP